MKRTRRRRLPIAAFVGVALTLTLLCKEGSAESAFTASGPANLPLWLSLGFLLFAASLAERETAAIFAAEAPGPWIHALTLAMPAAMAVAILIGNPVLALAFESAAALGLWRFLAGRLAAAKHRRHPGPLIASYAARILAGGAAADLLGRTGLFPAVFGVALHATAMRAFILLIAIAALRWSGFTGLRTGLAPFAAIRLRLSLVFLMVSFLVDAAADLGWLGTHANFVSTPIRMAVLARMRMRLPGILPMLPEAPGLARGVRLGLIVEVAALGAGLAPAWAHWNAEEPLHVASYTLIGGSLAFGAAQAATRFATPPMPSIRIRSFSVRGIIPAFLRRIA